MLHEFQLNKSYYQDDIILENKFIGIYNIEDLFDINKLSFKVLPL